MKLVDKTLTAFAEILASDAPAPGGGSTAALEGALGVALANMVAGLTVGKAKYADREPALRALMAKAQTLQVQLLDVIDRDTHAFNGVSAVFAMPKGTDGEKAARKEAMEAALKACTRTPFEMMECSLAGLELAEEVLAGFNTSAASDLGVSALSLKAGIQGAWLNILINIGGIKDEAFVAEYRAKGEQILAKALPLADKIYSAVLDLV